jgi:FlaA1/EpsC-like NDP-sugar epimerase
LQAASLGKGGEIFILDMGKPVKIVDLAHKMIELSGQDDIEVKFTGLRAGEKLHEELLIDASNASTQYESITIAGKKFYDIDSLRGDIEELVTCNDKIAKLQTIVPEFSHQVNN